jgi:hypothetical protein
MRLIGIFLNSFVSCFRVGFRCYIMIIICIRANSAPFFNERRVKRVSLHENIGVGFRFPLLKWCLVSMLMRTGVRSSVCCVRQLVHSFTLLSFQQQFTQLSHAVAKASYFHQQEDQGIDMTQVGRQNLPFFLALIW